ncbi:MAG: aldehyde dehydrogenase family protein [Treponema sp.]|nr:aldehyde dehydrogenase family protein [Treponema sp.]
MTNNEISLIVERARKAQGIWAELPYREKARRIKKAERALFQKRDEIVDIIHRENGKLAIDALAAELIPALMAIPYYIKLGKRFCKPRPIRGGSILMAYKRGRMVYRPWGVVGIISPWNYPFSIPFSEVIMALLAGNAVILKTASLTPGAGRIIAGILAAADLPEGLFTNVQMPGKDAGPAFVNSGIDKLFFTGSTAVGREIMVMAAGRLLPLVLELGGADAAIVCKDADIDRSVAGIIWSGFSNAGQSCGGVQRVLVHGGIYDKFMNKLKQKVEELRMGKDLSCDLGPLIAQRQKEEVLKQVDACIEQGAEIAAQSPGKTDDDDLFIPAIVLTNIKPGMPIWDDEIFGPVIGVLPFDDYRQALEIANSSPFALTASVWSRRRRPARKLAAGINAGSIMINDHLMSHGLAQTPWGGFGDSGIGRTHGEDGFREMLKAKVVIDDILPGAKREPWWQPYSQKIYRGLYALGDLLANPCPLKRIMAFPSVVKFFLITWKKNGVKRKT